MVVRARWREISLQRMVYSTEVWNLVGGSYAAARSLPVAKPGHVGGQRRFPTTAQHNAPEGLAGVDVEILSYC